MDLITYRTKLSDDTERSVTMQRTCYKALIDIANAHHVPLSQLAPGLFAAIDNAIDAWIADHTPEE